MTRLAAWCVVLVLLLAPRGTSAQTAVTPQLVIPVPTVLYISATNRDVAFAPTAAVLQSGAMIAPTASNVTHAGNVQHSVQVRALAPVWTATNGTSKPAAHLQWSGDGGATWTGFMPADVAVVSSAPRGQHSFDLMYRVLLGFTDQPGTYTLSYQFTIVAS